MFDIGIPELLLLSVVTLIFVGPKQLPEAVRTLAYWIGRLKRGLAEVRQEIEAGAGYRRDTAGSAQRQCHAGSATCAAGSPEFD